MSDPRAEFFKNYFAGENKKKNQLLDNLYQIPKKDNNVNMPHFQVVEDDQTHQADLLSMPTDKGYNSMLVVVDVGSRQTDAEPLKSKTADSVLQAFKTIYARKILKMPKRLEVDPGSEFKGSVLKYFNDHKVFVRVGKTARHRQQALVERRNQIIGKALFQRMAAEELLTDQPSTEWVDDLPFLITEMNKNTPILKPAKPSPVCSGDSCNLLQKGTKVRAVLEQPEDVASGKRLHGGFRSTDIRWDPKQRVVKEVLLKPGFPPMYLLEGKVGPRKVEPVAYTKNQLQVIKEGEEYPSHKLIKNPKKLTVFKVEKIVNKKKEKNKIMYEIKWAGYDSSQNTWEPRTQLMKDVPDMIKQYEATN